ncbi:MAG TPA: MarR family transcriptional regulator [Candidatus Acidoferrum sp.]|nr:MarR family transcriptional regulator [Candidatus Acidoferrum sp.]
MDMQNDAVRQLMEFYPRIYFACHRRHVRDPKSKRVLSAHQGSILDHLDQREPVMLLELARHMGVTPSTMSLQVEQLVRKSYVTRARDKKDGRRLMLRLSASGVRVREANSVLDTERVGKMLSRLSPEERAAGLAGLALLAKAAREQTDDLEKRRKRGRGRLPD